MPTPTSALGTFANILIACLIAGALYFASPRTSEAGCLIFQERDYQGSALSLRSSEILKMSDSSVTSEPFFCAEPDEASGCDQVIYDSSWNDRVSSFKLGEGCTLTLWQDTDQGGARLRAARDYLFVGRAWDNAASEARCMCR